MKATSITVAFVLAMSSFLISTNAHAHPHGWIDLSVRVITDDQGLVSSLHQTWRMDPFYSLVVFEELQQAEGASLEEGLDQLGKEIRDNLATQHYLTEVRINNEPQALGEVSEYTAMERDGRLIFMFILPLKTPQPLTVSLLSYQVFDPTYYIEVVHEEEDGQPRDDALIYNGEPACELAILPADPDPEVVMQAALLDKDESGEPGLGRYFAETGQIDCR
ncbi:DUF1007 domain-containing protein [Vreelandella sulfidaeris]|uniref:DUF1007 domain-containing protein n=1 Tax=Vreelandella sulfidaeris TaxID=115553 RepID=A0A365TSQ8_9GAMM|nr:DUF1007 family protein [Halomonas sulfidaeris]RBI68006.1 DUF1007 domain-containing protein [Halomonas sulfidaeris]